MTILVSRAEVQAQDTSGVQRILQSFVRALAQRNRNRVVLLLSGYDDDTRELFQIAEVRTWFHRIFDNVPSLFYWMDMSEGRLLMYALMMFQPVRVKGGTSIDPESMQQFLVWGYSGLNEFCGAQAIDPLQSTEHIASCIRSAA